MTPKGRILNEVLNALGQGEGWYRVTLGRKAEFVVPAGDRRSAISFVQDRLGLYHVNASGQWGAFKLAPGPWRRSVHSGESEIVRAFTGWQDPPFLTKLEDLRVQIDAEIARLELVQRMIDKALD